MSEGTIRIKKAATECNISVSHVVEHLSKAGYTVEANPNAKITEEMYQRLLKDFGQDIKVKEQAASLNMGRPAREEAPAPKAEFVPTAPDVPEPQEVLVKGLSTAPARSARLTADKPELKVVGKIALDEKGRSLVEGRPKAKDSKSTDEGRAESGAASKSTESESSSEVSAVDTTASAASQSEHFESTASKNVKEKGDGPISSTEAARLSKGAVSNKPKSADVESTASLSDSGSETSGDAAQTSGSGAQTASDRAQTAGDAAQTSGDRAQTAASDTAQTASSAASPDAAEGDEDVIRAKADKLQGTRVLGSIDLKQFEKKKPVASSVETNPTKRKRLRTDPTPPARPAGPGTPPNRPNSGPGAGQGDRRPGVGGRLGGPPPRPAGGSRKRPAMPARPEHSEKDIQDQIKATMARLQGGGKSGAKARMKRKGRGDGGADEVLADGEKMKLQVTEFLTTGDLAQLMDVSVAEIIQNCFMLGLVVTINQRLDAETIAVVADEFGYEAEFISADAGEPELIDADDPDRMTDRPPIVTIMGHVDHGKTSLLDYIRKENVIAGEAGGITQHIGAYAVQLADGRHITFLDTPGHEAFTAMRARGAKVTDIVVVVIAADDQVMPQTKEAISHAQAAGVPIIFAFNKMDKPAADAERIKEQLSQLNILVESWGGKYQDQEISAKKGTNVDLLLEKILLEAEILELKADSEKRAAGTVIEASLDKGRGVVTTVLVQGGTMSVGDPILAGANFGKVKAMLNERGQRIQEAGPSTPVQLLGFNTAPTAGDILIVPESEAVARDISSKRQQLLREQGIRTRKHITLDEIGRRLAIGNFKELKLVVKGDVDGSVEALSDSLMKLSTEQIMVTVIHKGVGQITESDVMLASASDAIIVGFQVRPLASVRKLAEQEQIDIRTYSVIYDAIEEIKSAMEGMLAPTFEEKVLGTVEIREVFKITRVGNIAGCMVLEGKVTRNSKIRLLREGVIVHTGELASLRRFKDDVKEVNHGYECGLNLTGYQDIRVGDIIEAFERVEVKARL
ncbi:MAG: translation initiation factor IF-2 [Bacteroidetes bacterium]|nr:translation initiation factor IF-2 [Bacteroidota bacterium]